MYDLRHAQKPDVFVRLRYSNGSSQCLQLEYKTQSGSLSEGMQEFYVYFLLSTKDPVKQRPTSVALSLDTGCDKVSTDIAVQGLVPGPGAVTYGVCLHKALFQINEPQVRHTREIYSDIFKGTELYLILLYIYCTTVSLGLYLY